MLAGVYKLSDILYMGNQTKVSYFKARERLRFIEQTAYWKGTVNRHDIVAAFDLSMAQASADFQAYQQLNPDSLVYSLNAKTYLWGPKAKPALHQPDFEEALALFGEGETARVPVGRMVLPQRKVPLAVARAVLQAVLAGEVLRVVYCSVDSGEVAERRLAPRAFGFDGFRWHVRAWCFTHGAFRDFVLGRMEKIVATEVLEEALPEDEEWEREVMLTVRVNPKLKAATQRALERDFGMEDGVLRHTVREALAFSAQNYFRSLWHPEEKQSWFLVEE